MDELWAAKINVNDISVRELDYLIKQSEDTEVVNLTDEVGG